MSSSEGAPAWKTRYSPFAASRRGVPETGKVEIIMLDGEDISIAEAKEREADVLARRIEGLAGSYQVTDRDSDRQRRCGYKDMVILLRRRTHLKRYEEALRRYGIPFVVVKGIGFYQEPEIAMLRALICFLSNPKDDYSLYILLKSPLFMFKESSIVDAINAEGDSLFAKLGNMSRGSAVSRWSGLAERSVRLIEEWLSQIPYLTVAELIEGILVITKAWRSFNEPQRHANIKKFIRLVEELESSGRSLFKIRDFLERTSEWEEEPKANVNSERMDAVKIMTIHAAKGLEFPIVFIPSLDEPFTLRTRESLVYEKDGHFFLKTEPEASIRRKDEDFHIHLLKEEEEQKRLFYVALTRAEDALFLVSRWSDREDSFLGLLKDGLGLRKDDEGCSFECAINGLSLLTEKDVEMLYRYAPKHEAPGKPSAVAGFIPLPPEGRKPWKAVTEAGDIRRRHGQEWLILGDIIHKLFEEISKGVVQDQDIIARAGEMLQSRGVIKEVRQRRLSIVEHQIKLLKDKGLWQEIIMPRKDSFSELPFILESGDSVYSGRIDRVLRDDGLYRIYDYKTFPVREGETEYLVKEYSLQLSIYKKAVSGLFDTGNVRSYILFTHTGETREI
jgi:ATP-dependent helicase/nuclease subunit A